MVLAERGVVEQRYEAVVQVLQGGISVTEVRGRAEWSPYGWVLIGRRPRRARRLESTAALNAVLTCDS
jgi:hypothetical protein